MATSTGSAYGAAAAPLIGRQIRPLDISRLGQSAASAASKSLSFEIHDLDTCPPFIALSYTWGNVRNPRLISLDDHLTTIRTNLDAFLTQAAPKLLNSAGDGDEARESHYLWVDTVCIN